MAVLAEDGALRRAVRREPAVRHQVGDRHAADEDGDVGHDPPVSATIRRWQRHHTLSLHITATGADAASASTSSSAAANAGVRVCAA